MTALFKFHDLPPLLKKKVAFLFTKPVTKLIKISQNFPKLYKVFNNLSILLSGEDKTPQQLRQFATRASKKEATPSAQ